MIKIIPGLALGATLMASAAFGQTGPGPASPAVPNAKAATPPTATSSPMTPQVTTTPMPPPPTPSTQPSTASAPASAPNPVTIPATGADSTTPPLAGANSFTLDQARRLIEENGFSAVSDLRKDEQSIWRAHAIKDGQTKTVSVDYKGNIVSQ